jgi:flavin prenyltransferase
MKPVSNVDLIAANVSAVPRRLIIGISGASGAIYGVRLLQLLRELDIETHLVISKSAEVTIAHELDLSLREIKALATHVYASHDIAAAISSGSFRTLGMVVAPCSVRSMSEIATGVTTGLLTRAADVVLKERRRLVLMVRETPLHLGHLRTLTQLAEMGAIVAPPVPAFYSRPATVEALIDHSVGRVLDLFELDVGVVKRWGEAGSGTNRSLE